MNTTDFTCHRWLHPDEGSLDHVARAPYAVGVDIACRMTMTVPDIPVRNLEQKQDRLASGVNAAPVLLSAHSHKGADSIIVGA